MYLRGRIKKCVCVFKRLRMTLDKRGHYRWCKGLIDKADMPGVIGISAKAVSRNCWSLYSPRRLSHLQGKRVILFLASQAGF